MRRYLGIGWHGAGLVACIWAAVLVSGCSKMPEIQRYQAPKDPLPIQQTMAPPAVSTPARLVAAVVRHQADVWFFKVTASPDLVQEHQAALRRLVQSVTFDSTGNPVWELPDGWSESPGDAIRYRTLRSGGEVGRTLEVSVTRLPSTGGDWDAYLLANVNRWRNQIGLPPLSAMQLTDAIQLDKTASGEEIFWCDFENRPAEATTSDRSPDSQPVADSARGSLELGPVPSEWKALPADALRQAAFVVDRGGKRAEVTLIALGPQSGSLVDNVNRWRNQIGLPPWTEQQVQMARKSLVIGKDTADYFELTPDDAQGEAILGVIARRPDRVWYFKWRGPAEWVAQDREAFRKFVEGTRLP